jgi:alpha-D-ribose 1-methylphosphonate 5-triphosphate synthase subunit PhnH
MTLDRSGFCDPVMQAQGCFRRILKAMSEPGTIVTLDPDIAAPPLMPAAAAVLLTMVDSEVQLWLDDALAPSWEWLVFHAGAGRVEQPGEAAFLCATTLPPLSALKTGSDAAPEDGATVLLQVAALTGGPQRLAYGPGLAAPRVIAPQGLPADFDAQWQGNHALFPRGVDLLLCAGNDLCALPRSLRIGVG